MPKKSMEVLTESMFYVLMAFQSGPMCGTDVADYIEKRTRGRLRMGPATLYTILGKFEKVDGRRRTYLITEKGAGAYHSELKRLQFCVADALAEQQREVLDNA